MATIKVHNHLLLTYESDIHQQKYWVSMSSFIFTKYGKRKIDDYQEVDQVLIDCFEFLLNEFQFIIKPIDKLSFYRYCFFLHEELFSKNGI